MSYRLGVDVGGTFTDFLLINEVDGSTHTAKVLSTPEDSSIGVLQGVSRICDESGINPQDIKLVMHGSTVATNAVLTGKGARVGLVTTEGYESVLQVARSFCPGGLGGWTHFIKKPLLAPLELTVGASGRIDAEGNEITPVIEEQVKNDLQILYDKDEVEALTISLINSYINPQHEKIVEKIAKGVFKNIPISISSEVIPEMQEYERAETTVLNSYVRPEVSNYVNNLQKNLNSKIGSNVQLSILRSDGGLASSRSAADSPVNHLMSGPAGGVAGAIHFCDKAGFKNILTFDMGGTSTDVALIQNSRARVRRETLVGDVRVRAPSVDVRTVGAGGGSIAFVPELTKALRVGPESAGADPGPAAYMKGGEEPTVCDANIVLGFLPSDVQLGGAMSIDKKAAEKAVQKVADSLGIDLMDAAEGIIKIVNESMFGALRLVSVEQGYDPRDFALIGFGGAGPLHANALGILSDSFPVIIPPGPGVLCAYGDATTQIQDEATRTYLTMASDVSLNQFIEDLNELKDKASKSLIKDGIQESYLEVTYQADLRYSGQAFQITREFSEADINKYGIDFITNQFDDEHEQLFTFKLGDDHEILMIRAIVKAKATSIQEQKLGKSGLSLEECKIQDTRIYHEGEWHDAVIYKREMLNDSHVIDGPAIISEMDSTTVVLPGYKGRIDQVGNLLINKTV